MKSKTTVITTVIVELKLAVCFVLSNLISCCNLLFSTCSYIGAIVKETKEQDEKKLYILYKMVLPRNNLYCFSEQ